ncbi:MAG: GNAT family N-acetyltransferase [Actinobacteria bacterium]|nr:GNAT family N-acetyltransferase [Actinomycetota bacterium]
MFIEDKAILSTWIYYLDSLKSQSAVTIKSLMQDRASYAVITKITENLYNSIFLKQPRNNIELCEELRIIQSKLKLPLTAWVTPETETKDLSYMVKNFKSPGSFYGMLLDLEKAQITPCPDYIEIHPVESKQDINDYANAFCRIFQFPSMLGPTIGWLERQLNKKAPSIRSYIAKINGEIAGISSLIINKDFTSFKTGGLYNGGVLPQFRNRGVGTAMACYRVNIAKSMQLKNLSILLMSDAMARGYCERLGFIEYSPLTPFYIA